jgi:two-component system sensor histidine kinase GlrK
MLAGVSLYFIYHLSRMNQITRSIIVNDTSVLEYSNQLTDALLSEVRYDRKYVVLKNEELYHNHLQAKREFDQLLNEAFTKAVSEKMKHFFYTIDVQHKKFNRLITAEREMIRGAKPYSEENFSEEKKKISDGIIDQLKNIRLTSEKNVLNKIVNLRESGDEARFIAITISVIALSTGLLIAFFITRSIKRPLDVMRAKTVEISKGNFCGDLEIKSPPVIGELAAAINTMCNRLQEVDNIKSNFFSHMSHELRTPLTSIKEGTTMLLDGLGGDVSEKQKRILAIVGQESKRMIDLVNSLLDLSKMEAGMLEYQFSQTNLALLIKKSLDSLAPLTEAKKITVVNEIETMQPVKADQERLLQVFHNIIGNAIKFTPEKGNIRLEAETEENFIEVRIHDTGIGIRAEDLERIFHKFQQIAPTKGQKINGTGLGLATVKQIILAHGGKVWATSRIGTGSTFYIALPLAA